MPRFLSAFTSPFQLDARSLAAFRVVLGLVLLADLVFNRWVWFDEMYAADGIVGNEIRDALMVRDPQRGAWGWTFLAWFEADAFRHACFAVTGLAMLAFCVGYRARWAGILAFAGLWSIHQYNPAVLSGPDELLICLLLWSLFLPLDAAWAIRPGGVPQGKVGGLAAFAFLAQVALLYTFNAYLKQGPTWQNGHAVEIALMEDYWRHDTALWLLEYPAICRALTFATKYLEYGVALLLVLPLPLRCTRTLAIACMVAFHGTIAIFLNLGLFPWIILAICLALLPSAFWDRFFPKMGVLKMPETAPRMALAWSRRVLIGFLLLLVLWKNALRVDPQLPYPDWLQKLDHTSLFTQNWGFYSPDPSLAPGCFVLHGIQENGGRIDLTLGTAPDEAAIRANVSYTMGVFLYKTIVYDFYYFPAFSQSWARHAYRTWNADPTRPRIRSASLILLRKRINAYGVVLTESWPLEVATWPPKSKVWN